MSDDFWMVCIGDTSNLIPAEYKAGKSPDDKIVELVGFSSEPVQTQLKSLTKVPLVNNVELIAFVEPLEAKKGHVIAVPGFIRAHRKFTGQFYPLKKYLRPHFTVRDDGKMKIHSLTLLCHIKFSGGTVDKADIQVEWDEWIAIREGWNFNIVGEDGVIGAGTVTKVGA